MFTFQKVTNILRVPIIRAISTRDLMDRAEDKNIDEEDGAGNSGEEDDLQSIRLAAPAPFYFPNHLENKEVIPSFLLTHWQ